MVRLYGLPLSTPDWHIHDAPLPCQQIGRRAVYQITVIIQYHLRL